MDAAGTEGIREIERLVGRLEASENGAASDEARELVRGVLGFHRAAIEKLLAIVAESKGGPQLVGELGADELVGSLLVLHGLHPESIEARARVLVDQLKREHPTLQLVGVEEGIVRLELRDRGGAAATLVRRVVEANIVEALPDALGVVFVDEPPLVQLRKKAP